MQQVEEVSSPTAMKSDGFLFKSEMIEQPPLGADSTVAPPQVTVQPMASTEPRLKGPTKRVRIFGCFQ
jgi:hypothetical protein